MQSQVGQKSRFAINTAEYLTDTRFAEAASSSVKFTFTGNGFFKKLNFLKFFAIVHTLFNMSLDNGLKDVNIQQQRTLTNNLFVLA